MLEPHNKKTKKIKRTLDAHADAGGTNVVVEERVDDLGRVVHEQRVDGVLEAGLWSGRKASTNKHVCLCVPSFFALNLRYFYSHTHLSIPPPLSLSLFPSFLHL